MGTQAALRDACEIAKPFEGLRLRAYRCPAGVWTIGYGHTGAVREGDAVTAAEAEALLRQDMARALLATLRHCPNLAGHPRRLAAIADFTFNLGSGNLAASTLRRKILAEDWDEAAEQLQRWVRAGGRVLLGLVRRRLVEAVPFFD